MSSSNWTRSKTQTLSIDSCTKVLKHILTVSIININLNKEFHTTILMKWFFRLEKFSCSPNSIYAFSHRLFVTEVQRIFQIWPVTILVVLTMLPFTSLFSSSGIKLDKKKGRSNSIGKKEKEFFRFKVGFSPKHL